MREPPVPSVANAPAPGWSARLCLVCLVALSVSLPMAWISLAKVLLFVAGLGYLGASWLHQRHDAPLNQLWTPRAVLALVVLSALSLAWTEVELPIALASLLKHAKLLGIVLLIGLIRTEREARLAVLVFAAGQIFVLLSSWLLYAGIPLPWVLHEQGAQATQNTLYVVFSGSYLDQSIMFGAVAAVFWHLRAEKLWPRSMGAGMALLALANVFLVLKGRSGYAIALTSLALAAMWAMPRRWQLLTLILTPVLVLSGLSLGSAQVQERVLKIWHESKNYAQATQQDQQDQQETQSSSGWRLNAWRRSLQAIQEQPWHGHGVGSWTPAVKRLEGSAAERIFGAGNNSNPHQEYLLWGVELGIGGILLLCALLACVVRDARRFSTACKRATCSVAAATAMACLFNSALYDDLMGDYLCVSLGLLLALGLRQSQQNIDNIAR